jgi:hypothetical protein
MNRFVILMLSGMLLLATGARAEEIYLKCIFKNGYIVTDFVKLNLQSEGPRTNIPSNDSMAVNGYLKIDTKKKIIIESSLLQIFPKEWTQTLWSDNEINHAYYGKDRKENGSLRAINTYTLNRHTGSLNEVWTLLSINKIAYRNWDCDKSTKKF